MWATNMPPSSTDPKNLIVVARDSSEIEDRVESAIADIIFIAHGANRGIQPPNDGAANGGGIWSVTGLFRRLGSCDTVIRDQDEHGFGEV